MALSGIQIYKLLPQTNCKECGFPTCLAFAMKLAAKQVELSEAHVVDEIAGEWNRFAFIRSARTSTEMYLRTAGIMSTRSDNSLSAEASAW